MTDRIGGFFDPIAIQGAATRENPNSGPGGVGVRDDGVAYTLEARAEVQAVAFRACGQEGYTPSAVSPPVAASDGGGSGVPTVAYRTNAAGQVTDQGDLAAAVTTMTDPSTQFLLQPVAFTCKDHGADAGKLSPTLRAMGHAESHANSGGQVAVAIQNATRGKDQNGLGISDDGTMYTLDQGSQHAVAFQSSQSGIREVDTHATLDANNGSRRHNGVVVPKPLYYYHDYNQDRVYSTEAPTEALTVARKPNFMVDMAVRRLTPVECERLQGFRDNYTAIPQYNSKRTGEFGGNKGVADGPRYRALGNSMAVPCMSWIGKRIAAVDKIVQR